MSRPFPRPTSRVPVRRRALVALATTGLLLAAAVPATGDDLDDKQDKVQAHIDHQQQDLDESTLEVQAATSALLRARDDLAAAQATLARTRGELAAAEALDQEMQSKLDAAVDRLAKAREALGRGRADVTEQEGELKQMVVAAYEQGDPALMGLSMVFTTQDPARLAGNMNATNTAVNIESTVLDQLEAAKVLLTVKKAEMQSARAEVAEKRQDAADNLALKQTLEQQAADAEQQVADMVDLRAAARATAMKAKSQDLAALATLQAERDRIEQLIQQQAAQSTTSAGSTGSTGSVDGGGFLDVPVAGSITSPYGWRIHPIYGYRSLHDGVDFGAGCGTPIRAAAPGRVLAEYFQTAWGNRIIIDHGVHDGVNVSTISNHLSGYAVSTGATVQRGQVIGYVGTTGWSTGCHLHFTVLQNGVAVDPMSWF